MKLHRIIIDEQSFKQNFKNNPTYTQLSELQEELDQLVERYNQSLNSNGFQPKSQLLLDKIILLKNKLES